jgi:hypothetical protein
VEVPKKQTKIQDLAAAMPPGHFRMILKKKKFNLRLQASSHKQQAASIKQQALDKPGL